MLKYCLKTQMEFKFETFSQHAVSKLSYLYFSYY